MHETCMDFIRDLLWLVFLLLAFRLMRNWIFIPKKNNNFNFGTVKISCFFFYFFFLCKGFECLQHCCLLVRTFCKSNMHFVISSVTVSVSKQMSQMNVAALFGRKKELKIVDVVQQLTIPTTTKKSSSFFISIIV